jgi:hypothetical protein
MPSPRKSYLDGQMLSASPNYRGSHRKGGDGQLAAGLDTLDDERIQVGPGGIDGGGEAGGFQAAAQQPPDAAAAAIAMHQQDRCLLYPYFHVFVAKIHKFTTDNANPYSF